MHLTKFNIFEDGLSYLSKKDVHLDIVLGLVVQILVS